MNCLSPFTIKTLEGRFVAVPCGKCPACRERERNDWFQRLLEEWHASQQALFVCWTYDDEHRPVEGVVRSHMVNWRKLFQYHLKKQGYPPKFSYFIISEYGTDTQRPHYHGLLFFSYFIDIYAVSEIIRMAWPHAPRVTVDTLIDESGINYCCGYVHQRTQVPDGSNKNFKMVSRSLGAIFLEDVDRHAGAIDGEPFYWYNGAKLHLTRYYRERLLSSTQQEEYNQLVKDYVEERQASQLAENAKHGQPFHLLEQEKEDAWRTMAKKYVKHHKL